MWNGWRSVAPPPVGGARPGTEVLGTDLAGATTTTVPAGELVEALRQVVRASSSDDARPPAAGRTGERRGATRPAHV